MGLACGVIAIVGWVALWQPLVRDSARLEAERTWTARELALARRDAEEIARLARAPLPAPIDVRSEFERSLSQAGLRAAVTQLEWQERRVRITLGTAALQNLVTWLESLQRSSGLRVIEATLSARVEPGTVRAELVLGH